MMQLFRGQSVMNYVIHFISFLFLISCTSVQFTPIDAGNGKQKKLICSEFDTTLEECKSEAKVLCGSDFKLIDHYAEVPPDPGDGFYVHPTHYLLIECNS